MRVLRTVVLLLAAIGIAAALGRAAFGPDLAQRLEPWHEALFMHLGVDDPLAARRRADAERYDRAFADNPVTTMVHVLPAAIFLLLAPLQFSGRIRKRWIAFHRWSGRLLVVMGMLVTASALYFGLLMPYAGAGEAAVVALFASLLAFSMARGWLAIRRRQVAAHREWMMRAFAIALAVSVARLVLAALDFALAPYGIVPSDLFAASLWLGFMLTLGCAEAWIRRSRPSRAAAYPLADAGVAR